ncbi:MAG: thiamine-phosphate kinase [Candidatus Eremiobacteraeota bacterium]|nr:thiamine-phosphate kinase [Candidatus Eremiobacteraeota bacterium]
MNVAIALGEDDIVAAIAAIAGRERGRILLGIGDDAAVWQPSRSARSVITTDALIENVHFSRATMSMEEIGWRAMAANLSDIAAMGARPVLATIALGIPVRDAAGVRDLYRGLVASAESSGCAIAGGDLTRAPVLTLAITVVGEVRPSNLKTRAGALPGDVLAVTGPLGASRAGLALLQSRITLDGASATEALKAYRTPSPRIAEGRWFGASRNVHAMMDCSDGLSTDLARLCASSSVGARITAIPIAASAVAAAERLGDDSVAFALAGGEDFELLVSIDARAFGHLEKLYRKRFRRPLEAIGTVQPDERLVLVKNGREEPLPRTGWDHFEDER